MSNWVSSLDLLAANGVLDYDGAAYLHGTAPRYVGNPMLRTNPQPLPPSTAVLQGPPGQDTFNPSGRTSLINNPGWKKLLFTGVASAALIFSAIKFKGSKPVKWAKTQCTNAWNWCVTQFKKVRP